LVGFCGHKSKTLDEKSKEHGNVLSPAELGMTPAGGLARMFDGDWTNKGTMNGQARLLKNFKYFVLLRLQLLAFGYSTVLMANSKKTPYKNQLNGHPCNALYRHWLVYGSCFRTSTVRDTYAVQL
jgi:hypothetical protein